MFIYLYILCYHVIFADPLHKSDDDIPDVDDPAKIVNTRRILYGNDVDDTRPYMVYLRPSTDADPKMSETNWLCGGVIINERYILTSAACIEDVKQFYVVSGTHRWTSSLYAADDECVKYGSKRAIWKCVPMSYIYDGNEFDNIRWMEKDIAVVKVEDEFNFKRRVKGCDFIPQKIDFNDKNIDLEKPGTIASISGWGSTSSFVTRRAANSPQLLETSVVLLSKKNCKKRWEPRYHRIIEENMICAKSSLDTAAKCTDGDVTCKELVYSDEVSVLYDETRRIMDPPMVVHTAAHLNDTRRTNIATGGFCENDHGGPLVVGHGRNAVVIGVISACLTKDVTLQCYGPFLFTSVWKNRYLINCAIDREIRSTCRKLLRTTNTQMVKTTFDWNTKEKTTSRNNTSLSSRELHQRTNTTKRTFL